MEKNIYIKRKGALFEHSQAESITRDIRVVHLWWPSPCQGADGCEWTAAARSGCHMSCMRSLPPHCSASACCCWIAQSRQAHCSTSMLLSLVLAQFTPASHHSKGCLLGYCKASAGLLWWPWIYMYMLQPAQNCVMRITCCKRTCCKRWIRSQSESCEGAAAWAAAEAHGWALHVFPPSAAAWRSSHAQCHLCMDMRL